MVGVQVFSNKFLDIEVCVISHSALLLSEAQIPVNILPKFKEELVQWVFRLLKQKIGIHYV